MRFDDRRKKISIYINRRDRYAGRKLYRYLLKAFYDMEVSGCTVFKSDVSYGTTFKIHSLRKFSLRRNKGLLLQVIETERKFHEIMSLLDKVIPNGIVTVEDVSMTRYTATEVTEADRDITRDSAPTSIGTFSDEA